MNFFERTNEHLTELNENEQKIFEYVVRNMQEVKNMQIRSLAASCFVSTTTIIRFAKKLGFEGYRELIESVKFTCHSLDSNELPDVLWRRGYSEDYLKNVIESVRVISQEKIDKFRRCATKQRTIYFYGTGLDREAAHYAYRLFTSMGYYTYCPTEDYEVQATINQLKDDDILFLFSLSGEDRQVINLVESARLRCKPVIATVTQSANNLLQSMSDIDFYVFTDHVKYKNLDLSARISMIAIAEMLVYSLIAKVE
ncbi:MAG: MurR/RpiR family transcriptional regulator [Clostridia bacterium]